jgi:hypothetical protein
MPIPVTTAASDGGISVFKHDGATYIREAAGATLLRHAERCRTLQEMPDELGCTTLPLSRTALLLWQNSVSEALPPSSRDVHDLCIVAQVWTCELTHPAVQSLFKRHDNQCLQFSFTGAP